MPVAEAQQRVDSVAFVKWQAYERIRGPLGPMRQYICAGIIAAAVRNSMRGKDDEPFHPSDFIPEFYKPEDDEAPQPETPPIDIEAARMHLAFSRMKAQEDRKKQQA